MTPRSTRRSSTRASLPCWTLALASVLLAGAASAATLPEGTLITGSNSAGSLLGADTLFVSGPGSNVTALSDTDLEFLSDDTLLGIDFFSDGLVRVYDNSGTGLLAGPYVLSFDFAAFSALTAPLTGFVLADVSSVTGGSLSASWLGGSTVQLSLSNLSFSSAGFESFTAQVSAVPEPGAAVMGAAGLALLIGLRRRQMLKGQA